MNEILQRFFAGLQRAPGKSTIHGREHLHNRDDLFTPGQMISEQ